MQDTERLMTMTVAELDRLRDARHMLGAPIRHGDVTVIPFVSDGCGLGAGGTGAVSWQRLAGARPPPSASRGRCGSPSLPTANRRTSTPASPDAQTSPTPQASAEGGLAVSCSRPRPAPPCAGIDGGSHAA